MSFVPHSVLITGANRGIGLEFVRQLLTLTPTPVVIATARDPSKATELQQHAAAHPAHLHVLKLEVTDYDSLPSFVEQVKSLLDASSTPGLGVLVNNAGVVYRKNLAEVTRDDMIKNFDTNTVAPLLLAKALLPLLKQSSQAGKRTLVANITSRMGSIEDNTSGSHYPYRASKAALNMVTRSLAVDLKPFAIEATAVHPGWVLTDMGGNGANLTTEQSVSSMLKIIYDADKQVSGKFFDFSGSEIPW